MVPSGKVVSMTFPKERKGRQAVGWYAREYMRSVGAKDSKYADVYDVVKFPITSMMVVDETKTSAAIDGHTYTIKSFGVLEDMEAYALKMKESIRVSTWTERVYIPNPEKQDYTETRPLNEVIGGREICLGVETKEHLFGNYTPRVETRGEEVRMGDRVGWALRHYETMNWRTSRLIVKWNEVQASNVPYHLLSRDEDGVLRINEESVIQ